VPLINYGSRPAILVTTATVVQNLLLPHGGCTTAIASTCCVCPWRDGQAELASVTGYPEIIYLPKPKANNIMMSKYNVSYSSSLLLVFFIPSVL